jgi:anti-anti-sigma regulatory factor
MSQATSPSRTLDRTTADRSQAASQLQSGEPETLELCILRLPECIDAATTPRILADLDRLVQPNIGVMLDFSQTQVMDPAAAHVITFAHQLAAERSTSIGSMGENDQIQAVLEFTNFLARVQKSA